MTDFLKDKNDFESLNLSDISDVDPDEIEKIVKSAGELDKKYIGLDILNQTFKEASTKKSLVGEPSQSITSASLEVKKDNEFSAKTTITGQEDMSFLLTSDAPSRAAPMSSSDGGRKRGRGSGDWLGLKDTPEETTGEKPEEGLVRRPPSSKGRLLQELFGEPEPRQQPDPRPQSETRFQPELLFKSEPKQQTEPELDRDVSYLPSRGSRRVASPRLLGSDVPATKFPEEPKVLVSEVPKPTPEIRKPTGQTPSGLPDWLLGVEKKTEDSIEKRELLNKKEDVPASSVYPKPSSSQDGSQEGGPNNILTLLAGVQKQLSSAMAKRNENLQKYLKALILEAERMSNIPGDTENLIKPEIKNTDDKETDTAKDKNTELIKEKDEQLNSVQISLTDLELQNSRLRLEIESLKSTHEMEKETQKKNYSYELAVYESRLERMKASFDEIESEYKEKIAKLKGNEAALNEEYKERLERAEQARINEMEKLGELHQAALQQALAISLPINSAGKVIKIPLMTNRPKDEAELSERETALLEKEKQLEVLKGVLEEEKEQLETRKLVYEEREKELKRKEKEARLREEAKEAELVRERAQLDSLSLQIKLMRDEAVREQGEIAKEKLELAAERARLEAAYSIQGRTDASMPPLDIFQARVEVEAALETAKEAKEAAETERRKHAERRQTVEQISWEQKEADLRLDNREKHLMRMLENAEKIRDEGFAALEEAKHLKSEVQQRESELQDQIKRIEAQEKILSKERLDIAREKIELERKRSQLDIFLPDLMASDDLSFNVPKVFVDPKAIILRLKAEKEFESATFLPN